MQPADKIVIICPDEELIKDWKKAITEKAPNMVVQIYPDDTERESTEFVLAFRPPEKAFENYPHLKVIASMAAGINHIIDNHKLSENIIITKANDPLHKGDIADFVLALTLSYMRRFPVYFQQKQQSIWESHPYQRPEETTIGIMGIGSIGKTIGKLMLKNNFRVTGWSRSEKHIANIKTFHGDSQRTDFLKTANILICTLPLTEETSIGIMGIGSIGKTIGKLMLKNKFKVTGWSRSEKHIANIKTFHGDSQRTDFLKTADILICSLPLTDETEGILNTEVFDKLPKGAYLINIGRGQQLVEADLLTAIENGQLAGAALDVFRDEPLPKNHPFWKNEKIMITPHTAGNVHPESAVKKILHNYNAMKNGEELVDVVDFERGY